MSNRQTGASRDRRPLLASLVLAWLGLAGLCFSLDVELGSHRVTFLWSLALPLIATLAYGWRAALLVAGPGLCALFPFVLWPTNGWANLVGMLEYGGWFLAHGLGAQARDRRPAWWNHPYAVQLAYTPVYLLLSLGPFAYSFTCNPPFWYPAAATGISGEVLWTITVKSLISLFAMTVLAEAMFRSASLRTLLGLPVEPCQRNSGRTVLLALAIGISLFGIRQWLNHALFVHDAAHPLAFHKEDALDLILFSLGGLMAGSLIAGYHVKARSATRAMQLTQHAFAQSLSATSIAGPDGRLTQANPSFLKLWNYREAVDVIGQPIATFLQDPGTARTILETLNRQGTWEGELPGLRPDGSCFTALGLATSITGENGQRLGYQCSALDITSQKEAERHQALTTRILSFLNANTSLSTALERTIQVLKKETGCEAIGIRLRQRDDYPYYLTDGFSPEFLFGETRLAARDSHGGLCRDADGRVRLECTCGLVLMGQLPGDAPFATAAGSFCSNDTTALLQTLNTGPDPRFHARNRCMHDGFESLALIPIRCKGEAIGLLQLNHRRKNAYNTPLMLTLENLAVHIGEAIVRRQTDAALAESQELTKEVARLAHIGGWQLDKARQTVVLTDEARSIMAVDAEFQPDLPRLLDFFEPASRARLQEALDAAVEAGIPFDLELELHAANGMARLAHVTGKAIWTENRITRVQGVMQDLTRQRQLEERLRQSEKLEAIGHLAAGIAHDFNNQLSGILGFADMLREHAHDPVHRSYAEQICHAGQHTAERVRQLLAFGRKGKFLNTPMDLHAVIREICEMLRRSMDPRIEIRQHLNAGSARVMGDPSQLQNAILTLGLNARDAMPDGGCLTFTTRPAPQGEDALADLPEGPYLWLTVADTGVGMSEDARRHAFEPFFTTRGVGEGTGLRLASVYGTVVNHHGAIRLASEPGKGCTFDLYLPALEEPGAALPAPREPREPRNARTILLVDDEPMLLDLGRAMLDSLGYRVTTCPSAEAAVAHYRQAWRSTDLVILDYTMPGRRGDQLFATLRDIHPGIRCLLSSGYSTPEEVPELMRAGLCGFIQKPFLRRDLSQAVAQALKKPPCNPAGAPA